MDVNFPCMHLELQNSDGKRMLHRSLPIEIIALAQPADNIILACALLTISASIWCWRVFKCEDVWYLLCLHYLTNLMVCA